MPLLDRLKAAWKAYGAYKPQRPAKEARAVYSTAYIPGSPWKPIGQSGQWTPAMPPPLAPGISWWIPGSGYTPWAPGSQFDYSRAAGHLDYNSIVAICLRWLRDNFMQAALEVGTEIDGQFEPDETSPLQAFLCDKPNPFYSWDDTWGATVDAFKVDGNAYWIKVPDDMGLIREVYWIPSRWVRVQTDPRGAIYKYIYTPGRLAQTVTAGGIEYEPEQVVHFRDSIDPMNPVMGLSCLKRNLRSIVGINSAENYTSRILDNMGIPGVVFMPDGTSITIDEEQAIALEEKYQQAVGGENRGKPFTMSLPMRMEKLGLSPEEMTLDRILDRPEAMIHAAMGLNALVTGCPSSDRSRTYSNIETAMRAAWETALLPMQRRFSQIVRDNLGPDFDLPPDRILKWNYSQVAALREDTDSRATRAVGLFQSTLYSRDQCLSTCGFDPVGGPDGERYYGEPTVDQEARTKDEQEQAMRLDLAQQRVDIQNRRLDILAGRNGQDVSQDSGETDSGE